MSLGYDLEVGDLGLVSRFAPGTEIRRNAQGCGEGGRGHQEPEYHYRRRSRGISELNDVFAAESIKIKGDGSIDLDNPDLRAEISTENAKIKDRKIESIEIDAESEGKGIDVNAVIKENDRFEYEIATTLRDLGKSEKHIEISKIRLEMEDTELVNRDNILLTVSPGKAHSGFIQPLL